MISSEFIPNSRNGKRAINRQQANKIINDIARLIGLEGRFGTHSLRKTFGYQAYQSGIDISILQKLLSVTLAYMGITQDDLDEIYLNLNL